MTTTPCVALSSAPMPTALAPVVAPGTLLADRYRVEGELGRGGMGIVYLCRDRATGELVALKRLFRGEAPQLDAEDVWWFQHEARALAALDHPAIVRGRDFGLLDDGTPYLAMDVARGRSLLRWLEIGAIPWPWPWAFLWSFVDQILAGLAHAHARGVIHGDLKPTNVMIDVPTAGSLPSVSILDLGLASLVRDPVDPRLEGAGATPGERTLRVGAGTPGWMAPEQIRRSSSHYGPPTDLYALGSILYHLFAGREPFTGTVNEVLEGHKLSPLPPFDAPANAPRESAEFVTRLLAKKPWQRWDLAGEARRAWARFAPPRAHESWTFRVEPPREGASLAEAKSPRARGARTMPPPEAPPASPGILSLRASPLVARDAERDALRELVARMTSPDGPAHGLVVLSGEAGVGKSRLAEWLCEHVHEQATMTPLRARYRKIPAPLDGIIGAVNAHFGLDGADRALVEQTLLNVWEVDPADDEGRTWVAATAEWLRPTAPGTTAPLGPSGKRFLLDTPEVRTRVIVRTLRKIAAQRPLLLWLDDLHLASERTFDALARIGAATPAIRILLVATVRAEALAIDPAAKARVDALLAHYEGATTHLSSLSADDTHRLLLASLPLDAAALDTATARSKGNPLYALQLLHAWAKRGRLELHEGTWRVPREALEQRAGSTSDLWEERLAAIPPELRGAAPAAAALGGDIPAPVLRELLGSLQLPVAAAVQALQRAEILLPNGPGRFRWPHALLQEHLLARLAEHPDAKLVFHKAADALALHPAAKTRRIVSHRVTNLERAGDLAAVTDLVLAFVESSWKRVRDVDATLNDLTRLSRVPPGPARAHYARWRAEALRHRGDFTEARQLADEARQAFASLADKRAEAHCLRLLGHIYSEQAAPGGRDLVAQGLAIFEAEGDEAGRAECEVVLGEIDYLLGDYDRAREELDRAARHAAAAGDTIARSQCLILLALIAQGENLPARATEMLEEARAAFDDLGYRLGMAQCDVALAHVAHRHGDLEDARRRAVAARASMRELGTPRGEGAAERLLSMIHLDQGALDAAREHALAAATIYDQMGDPWGQVESALLLAQIAIAGGNPVAKDLVMACSAVGLREAEPQQHLALTRAWLANVEGRHGDAEQALEAARRAFGTSKRTGDHTPALLARLAKLEWPAKARATVAAWRRELGAT